MKTCMVYGDLTSDRSSENYPIVQVCDECYEADQMLEDEAQIVSVMEDDPNIHDDDTCFFCGKTYKKELKKKRL
jgi:hypothetical protein